MGMPSAVKEIGQRLGLSPIELAFMAFKESWASLLVGFPVSVVGGRTKLVLLPGSFSLLGALGLPPHPAPPLPYASRPSPEGPLQATTFPINVCGLALN